ncbi:hypothetical protein LXA43DRAFT_1067570 [Ganoderma leucocontextum]|nr:hypothetical protein LXA43DRAFT_1067570 [Ganoderma leucocontextum]
MNECQEEVILHIMINKPLYMTALFVIGEGVIVCFLSTDEWVSGVLEIPGKTQAYMTDGCSHSTYKVAPMKSGKVQQFENILVQRPHGIHAFTRKALVEHVCQVPDHADCDHISMMLSSLHCIVTFCTEEVQAEAARTAKYFQDVTLDTLWERQRRVNNIVDEEERGEVDLAEDLRVNVCVWTHEAKIVRKNAPMEASYSCSKHSPGFPYNSLQDVQEVLCYREKDKSMYAEERTHRELVAVNVPKQDDSGVRTPHESTGGVAPRAKLGAKQKRRTWTQCTQDAEDSNECMPTASAKRKMGLNASMEEMRDCEEYVTSILGKHICLNPSFLIHVQHRGLPGPAIVEAEEQCASNDAGGVVDKSDGLYGQSSDGECSDGEILDGELSKADKPCVATVLLQPLEPLIVTDLSNLDGHPTDAYFPRWVSVVVHAARPQHIQVNMQPIVILSIRLISLDEESCPAHFLYNYLSMWFEGPAKCYLCYLDIPFSIWTTDDADKYRAQWDEILTALGHITNWWEQLIPSKVKQIAMTPSNELTIALIACGAIVNNEWPRRELKAVATDVGAKHMFCFGAMHLQAVFTVPFFMHFAQRVFLEGTELRIDNIGTVFHQSLFLACHTAIWFFSRVMLKNELIVDIYDWTHLTM